MLDFSIQGQGDAAGPSPGTTAPTWSTTRTCARRSSSSLLLALLTVVLMVALLVPTMIWVRLRVPRASADWSSSSACCR